MSNDDSYKLIQSEIKSFFNETKEEYASYIFENKVFNENPEKIFKIEKGKYNYPLLFINCTFENPLRLRGINFLSRLEFYNCSFKGGVFLEGNTFSSSFIIAGEESFVDSLHCASFFQDSVKFDNTTFKGPVSFFGSEFEQFVDFSNTEFCAESNFDDVIFKHNLLFRNVKSKIPFDFKTTFFGSLCDFDGLEEKQIKNRQSACKIKFALDNISDIIGANRFYALEMEKYEYELKTEWSDKNSLLNWIVFKLHKISSNYSQDWFLALLWIILVGMLLTIYKTNIGFEVNIIFTFIPFLYMNFKKYMFNIFFVFYFLFMFSLSKSFVDSLNMFASNINPFSIMTNANSLTFIELLFKITIAYLIYQLIISIRQNTRRK